MLCQARHLWLRRGKEMLGWAWWVQVADFTIVPPLKLTLVVNMDWAFWGSYKTLRIFKTIPTTLTSLSLSLISAIGYCKSPFYILLSWVNTCTNHSNLGASQSVAIPSSTETQWTLSLSLSLSSVYKDILYTFYVSCGVYNYNLLDILIKLHKLYIQSSIINYCITQLSVI